MPRHKHNKHTKHKTAETQWGPLESLWCLLGGACQRQPSVRRNPAKLPGTHQCLTRPTWSSSQERPLDENKSATSTWTKRTLQAGWHKKLVSRHGLQNAWPEQPYSLGTGCRVQRARCTKCQVQGARSAKCKVYFGKC